MFVLLIHYQVPADEVARVRDAHRAFLGTLYREGRLVCSGPRADGTGGVLVARTQPRDELMSLLAHDPFVVQGIGRYEVIEFEAKLQAEGFAGFV